MITREGSMNGTATDTLLALENLMVIIWLLYRIFGHLQLIECIRQW